MDFDIAFYQSLKGEEAVRARLSGRLPIIDIAGHPFFVEIRRGLLRPLDIFSSNGVNLFDHTRTTYDGKDQIFFYNAQKMESVPLGGNMSTESLHIVRVPNNLGLDPVTYGEVVDIPYETYLSRYPMKMYRTGEAHPVTEQMLMATGKLRPKESLEKILRIAQGQLHPAITKRKGKRL